MQVLVNLSIKKSEEHNPILTSLVIRGEKKIKKPIKLRKLEKK